MVFLKNMGRNGNSKRNLPEILDESAYREALIELANDNFDAILELVLLVHYRDPKYKGIIKMAHQYMLKKYDYNISKLSRDLNVSRKTLSNYLHMYGVVDKEGKEF